MLLLYTWYTIRSPTLDPSIVDDLKKWPPCRPLDDVPSRYEVEEAIRALANRTGVGADGCLAELFKVLADEGYFNTLGKFHDIIVIVWRGGDVPQQWKDATMEVLHNKKHRTMSVAMIVASLSSLTPAKYSSRSSRVA